MSVSCKFRIRVSPLACFAHKGLSDCCAVCEPRYGWFMSQVLRGWTGWGCVVARLYLLSGKCCRDSPGVQKVLFGSTDSLLAITNNSYKCVFLGNHSTLEGMVSRGCALTFCDEYFG